MDDLPAGEELERDLVDLLGRCDSTREAIWVMHTERGVDARTLARVVVSLFDVSIRDARKGVNSMIRGGAVFHLLPPPHLPDDPVVLNESGVLDRIETRSPLRGVIPSGPPAFRADLLPSFHANLRLSVHLTPAPVLRALVVEQYHASYDPHRVQVDRWPSLIDVETDLRHWSAVAYLSDADVETLRRASAALLGQEEVRSTAIVLDGMSAAGEVRNEGRVTRLPRGALDREYDPQRYDYFEAMVRMAQGTLGPGPWGRPCWTP